MQIHISKIAQTIAGVALLAGASTLPAAAATQYGDVHHRTVHRAHHQVYGSGDVTVRKSARREPVVAGHDAFHGPAAFITAPIEMAGTLVSLPFRAVEVIFPPRANDPRLVVGAPLHFAGQIAESPFYVINSAFGVRPTYYNFN